jgi:hypothetical protein
MEVPKIVKKQNNDDTISFSKKYKKEYERVQDRSKSIKASETD